MAPRLPVLNGSRRRGRDRPHRGLDGEAPSSRDWPFPDRCRHLGVSVSGDLNFASVDPVQDPAGPMIVRLVAVALRVYVAHLNEFGIGIAIKLPCRLALFDDLGHPGGQGGACLYGHTNHSIAI